MKLMIFALLFSQLALAYTPTVESVFRHGSNPEITTNAVSIAMKVTPLAEPDSGKFYKIFFSVFDGSTLKASQTTYSDNSFAENTLLHKFYLSHLTPMSLKNQSSDKGLFYSLMHSILLNDGQFIVDFLKMSGVPVKHNRELLNGEKIALMKDYKNYLVAINNDRSLKKTMVSPLGSGDGSDKPMYLDTNQVKLSSFEGKPAWHISAGDFQADVSYEERRPLKVKLKTPQGEIDIQCLDYWKPDGSHAIPKKMIVKTSKGESFQVETLSLRHYSEKEDDLVKRVRHWDEILRNRKDQPERADFLF